MLLVLPLSSSKKYINSPLEHFVDFSSAIMFVLGLLLTFSLVMTGYCYHFRDKFGLYIGWYSFHHFLFLSSMYCRANQSIDWRWFKRNTFWSASTSSLQSCATYFHAGVTLYHCSYWIHGNIQVLYVYFFHDRGATNFLLFHDPL